MWILRTEAFFYNDMKPHEHVAMFQTPAVFNQTADLVMVLSAGGGTIRPMGGASDSDMGDAAGMRTIFELKPTAIEDARNQARLPNHCSR